MKRLGFIIFIFISGFIYSQDSETLRLSVEEAKQYAVNHNKQLKNVRADTEIARHRFWEAVSQGLPQVSASFDYTDFFNYEIEFGMMGDGNGMDINPEDIAKLDEGDWVIINMLMSSLGGGPTTIKMQNSATAQLQLSQLIFSGQYIAGIQISRIAQLLADKNVVKTELDIRESVASSYYMALITEESIKSLDKSIENLKEIQLQTQAMINAGMIEPIDVDQIQMSITMIENTKRSMLRNLELSHNILRLQLGVQNNVKLDLSDGLESVINYAKIEKLVLADFLPEDNINYQMLETQEQMSNKMIDMERWAYAPTIAGVYTYNQKIITTEFDMNPRNLFAIRVSLPIFSSGMRKSRVDQRRIELFQIQNTKELLTDQLRMQEKQLRFNLINAMEQYESQKENVELAKRIYEHTEKKFKLGVVSSLELTQANSNYIQAESNYISAKLELIQAKLGFNKLLNNI
jgi:outer membrane protein